MIYLLIFYGLILFVGIPLPLTCVWTGSLAAYLVGLSKKKSVLANTKRYQDNWKRYSKSIF